MTHVRTLFIYQKYARNLREVGKFALPFLDGFGLDVFILASDVGSNAKLGLRTAVLHDVLHHLVVAIGGLDEELGLVFGINAPFQCLDALDALTRFDGQITMEGKALPIESRTHDGEYIHKLTITFLGLTKKHIIGSLQIGIAI